MSNITCEYCFGGCEYHWLELVERTLVDVPGEGGGIFEVRRLPFCCPDCLQSWLARRQDEDTKTLVEKARR